MAQPAPSHINLCSKVMAAGFFLKNEFSESMTRSPSSCLVDHLRFSDRLEGAAADTFWGDLGEEPLDHVEPGSRSRCEVQMKVGMGFEPALCGRSLMRGIIVDDEMKDRRNVGRNSEAYCATCLHAKEAEYAALFRPTSLSRSPSSCLGSLLRELFAEIFSILFHIFEKTLR